MKKRYYFIAIIVFLVCTGSFLVFHKLSYKRTCHNNIEKVMERCFSGKDKELLDKSFEKFAESETLDEGERVANIEMPDEEFREVYGSYMTDEALEVYKQRSFGIIYSEYEDVRLDTIEFTGSDSYSFDCVGTGTLNGKEETLHLHGQAECDENGKITNLKLQPAD